MKVLRAGGAAVVIAAAAIVASVDVQAAVGRTPGGAAVSTVGSTSYSMPIFAPPGTKGMTPNLSLSYSSSGGSGWIGEGWGIGGLSVITRCGMTWEQDGAPRNVRLDANDRFCLDGNRLRLISGSHGGNGTEYRTEIETFARVKSWGAAGAGPAYFIAEMKNGLIYEYGNTADSRIESLGVATARAWAVNKIRDRDGNAILFNYAEDSTNGSYRLEDVQYTENTNQGLSASYKIDFIYETQPIAEIDSGYLGGKLIKDIVRLVRVDVTHQQATLVRRYHVNYESGLSSTGKSRVQSLQECAGSSGTDCLAATTFGYQNGTPGVDVEINTGAAVPSTPWVLDVNGDGRDDLVYSSSFTAGAGTWMVMFGSVSGGYGAAINTGIANNNYSNAISIDYNADGLDDLLVPYSGDTWWVMLGTTSGLASPVNTGTPTTTTGVGVNAHAIDINGDGWQDLVWADLIGFAGGDAIRYRLRVSGGFSPTVETLVGPMEENTAITNPIWGVSSPRGASNPDFNGDGRDDLLYQVTSRVFIDGPPNFWQYSYYTAAHTPGSGGTQFSSGNIGQPTYGDFNGDGFSDLLFIISATGSRITYGTGTGFAGSVFGPSPSGTAGAWAIYDWNGDGFDDILSRNLSTGAVSVLRSTGEAILAGEGTGITSSDSPRVADVNGDGLMDLAYNSGGTWRVRLHAGTMPDLLSSVTDGYGNVTSFAYTSIAQGNYSKYSDAAFPEQDFAKPLTVVSAMTSADGVGGSYTRSYWYYGARVHLQGRGLEGFYAVRTQDSRNNLYTYDYYHRTFPLTGRLFQADLTQPNNSTLISRTVNTWAVQPYGSGYETRHLPYVSTTTASRYEAGGTYNGSLLSTTTTVNSLDSTTGTIYDSVTTRIEANSANGVQPGASYVERMYQPVAYLINDTSQWCIGRPGQVQLINSHNQYGGNAITRTGSIDWDAAKCRPTTVTVEPGNSQLQVTRSLGYDGFGNVNSDTISGVGMSARTTALDWGSTGQFPTALTNALSQSSSGVWDYSKGVPSSTTDPNGLTVSWQYDNFGRRTREDRPDQTAVTWSYEDCANSACVNSNNKMVVTKTLLAFGGVFVTNQRTYMDRFDRPIATSSLMLSGAYNRVELEYDALGRVRRESAPCWWGGCTPHWTTMQYDLVGRVTESARPVSDSDLSLQTAYTYYEGLTVRSVDPLGKQSTTVNNVAGQVARSIDHSGYFQSFDYDAFGGVRRVTDATGNTLLSNTYNIRGMRIAMSDIAAGNLTYTPNALGEIVGQVDAKSQQTTFEYDALGRMTKRIDAEDQSVWIWGASAQEKNIGRLALVSGHGYAESYRYDAVGRLATTTISSDATYQIDYAYNTFGALATLTYPTSTAGYRLKLQYEYENGHLRRVYDHNNHSTVFWTGNDTDARGNILSETLGNGIQTIRGYDTVNGRLDYLQSYAGGVAIQDLNYVWNRVGTLAQRQDARQGITENFYYDDLHRLTSTTGPDPIGVSYDSRGNITSMTGNVTSGSAHSFDWYSYNLPSRITGAWGSSTFYYGPDRSRWKQVATMSGTSETTIYIGGLVEKVTMFGITYWKHTIAGGTGPVAIYTRMSNGTNQIRYLTRDHLGSIDSISNAAGGIEVRLSFGSFGQRRNEAGWSGPVPVTDWSRIDFATRHGFTGHEMLDNLDLIHMNGRVYDQHAGRFISPDPYIDGVGHTQGWNRYTYVANNPLSSVDPSGYAGTALYYLISPEGRLPDGPRGRHWNGSPLGTAGLRSYDFSGAFSEEGRAGVRGVDRPTPYQLATNQALRQQNYENLQRAQAAAEAFRGAVLDRSGFMEQFGREYGYDTGEREHLNLPPHQSGLPQSAVDRIIGRDGGAAWISIFNDPWVPGPTGGLLPETLARGLLDVAGGVPADAYKNGMHAWHAGSNAYLARELGMIGAPLIFLGGAFHESPLDWKSFMAEQHYQGTINHLLDSSMDMIANVFGMWLQYKFPGPHAIKAAVHVGNYIPGPGDPDPAFGGAGAYNGDPTKAWGQYPQ